MRSRSGAPGRSVQPWVPDKRSRAFRDDGGEGAILVGCVGEDSVGRLPVKDLGTEGHCVRQPRRRTIPRGYGQSTDEQLSSQNAQPPYGAERIAASKNSA